MKRLVFLFAGLALLTADPAAAQYRRDREYGAAMPPAAQSAAPRLSPQQVMAIIQRRVPGRMLNIVPERSDGRAIYLVRWQTNDGRLIDFVVDGNTGSILSGG